MTFIRLNPCRAVKDPVRICNLALVDGAVRVWCNMFR